MGSTSCCWHQTVVALCNIVAVTQPQSRGCHYLAGASQQVLTYLYVPPYPGRPPKTAPSNRSASASAQNREFDLPPTDNWTLSASRLSLSLPTSSSRQHLGSCELSVCLLIPASLSVPPILLVNVTVGISHRVFSRLWHRVACSILALDLRALEQTSSSRSLYLSPLNSPHAALSSPLQGSTTSNSDICRNRKRGWQSDGPLIKAIATHDTPPPLAAGTPRAQQCFLPHIESRSRIIARRE